MRRILNDFKLHDGRRTGRYSSWCKKAIYSGKRELMVRRSCAHPETLIALENIGIHSGVLENAGVCRLTWNDTSEIQTPANAVEEDNYFPTPHYTPSEPCSDYGFEGGGF